MCLKIQENKRFVEKLKKQGKLICWKVVYQLDNSIFSSIFYTAKYIPGQITYSSRPYTELSSCEEISQMVYSGIYVFLTKEEARCYKDCDSVIIKVEVDTNDFIACNSCEAVFTQVKTIGKEHVNWVRIK